QLRLLQYELQYEEQHLLRYRRRQRSTRRHVHGTHGLLQRHVRVESLSVAARGEPAQRMMLQPSVPSPSLAVLLAACDGGAPPGVTPTTGEGGGDASLEAEGGAGADAGDSGTHLHYAVCPDAMAPTFSSIYGRMLSTGSCGVGAMFDCHSS